MLNVGYANASMQHTRTGNVVTATKIRREWVGDKFVVTRVTTIPWCEIATRADRTLPPGVEWQSCTTVTTRDSLIAKGLLKPQWHDQYALPMLYADKVRAFADQKRGFANGVCHV